MHSPFFAEIFFSDSNNYQFKQWRKSEREGFSADARHHTPEKINTSTILL